MNTVFLSDNLIYETSKTTEKSFKFDTENVHNVTAKKHILHADSGVYTANIR